jgi:hypothetical protein
MRKTFGTFLGLGGMLKRRTGLTNYDNAMVDEFENEFGGFLRKWFAPTKTDGPLYAIHQSKQQKVRRARRLRCGSSDSCEQVNDENRLRPKKPSAAASAPATPTTPTTPASPANPAPAFRQFLARGVAHIMREAAELEEQLQ